MIDINKNRSFVKLIALNSQGEEVTYLVAIKELSQTVTTPRMPIRTFGGDTFEHLGKTEVELTIAGRLIAVSDKEAAVVMTLEEAIEEIESADRFEGVG